MLNSPSDRARAARLLFQLPNDCRVFIKISPANQWGWAEVLANKMNHQLETLVWQKTKDAQKKAPRNRPKLYLPDFIKKTLPKSPINNGAESRTVEDVQSILAQPRG